MMCCSAKGCDEFFTERVARRDAARVENVELSPAYEPYAAELLVEAGLEGRVARHLLDFASRGDEVRAADAVILHKVVRCYPDYEALVGAAAVHAKRQLLLTFPRESWWSRLGLAAANLIQRLRGRAFRVYVHPPAAMIAVARSHGLEPITRHRGRLWDFCGLERIARRASS
jgi:hypothetical protein